MEKKFVPDPSPWTPITDIILLKHLGKLSEELSECNSAVARCIIQGVDECEPSTGECNRDWLQKELADVLCNIRLVVNHLGLSWDEIRARSDFKENHLKRWHNMGSAFQHD